jgi:hypothetical protein
LMIFGQFCMSQWKTGFLYGHIVVSNHPSCQSSHDQRTVCIAWNYLSSIFNRDEAEKFCHKSLKNVLIHKIAYIQIDFWCTWLSFQNTQIDIHTLIFKYCTLVLRGRGAQPSLRRHLAHGQWEYKHGARREWALW